MQRELIIDLFAGGGGASKGIELALGISPDVAVNHDPLAVQMHARNHPKTRHYCQDVWSVQPNHVTGGVPVGLLHASPDCTHFSKAKGGKPKDAKIRDLAWVIVRWAEEVWPRIITMENVEEFKTWGPLDKHGKPIPCQKGATFRAFVNRLKSLGYRVQWRELTAWEYGAPTIRKRLFIIARRDGKPIVWPKPTHGKPDDARVLSGELKPWRTAAEVIDWSLPCYSIFLTPEEVKEQGLNIKRPLEDATLRRVAKGVQRFVLDCAKPFIVKTNHTASYYDCFRGQGIDEPLQTITQQPGFSLATPYMVACNHSSNPSFQGQDINSPLWTVTGKPSSAVTIPTLVQTGYGEREGQSPRVPGLNKPLGTVVAGGCKHALVSPVLVGCGGPAFSGKPVDADKPLGTVLTDSRRALVSAFMAKHFTGVVGSDLSNPLGTVTAIDHHSLVAASLSRQFGASVGSDLDSPAPTVMPGGMGKTQLVTASCCKMRGTNTGHDAREPLHTVSAGGMHHALQVAHLISYYGNEKDGRNVSAPLGTVTGKDRHGLVTVDLDGVPFVIEDIGLRMLTPRELYRAQGFPDTYIIDFIKDDGKPLSKAAQVRMCGNSVPPPVYAAIVGANFAPQMVQAQPAAWSLPLFAEVA
jgi:DNA (cytosine-5)-methyltransferase 1